MNHVAHRTSLLRARHVAVAATALLAALATAACSSAGSPPQAASQAELEGAPHEAGMHGPLARLDEALARLQLDAQKRPAIDAIRADVRAATEPSRAAARELAAVVADGVAKGALDRAAVDQATEKLAKSVEAATPAVQAALDELHARLDAGERRALVEAMRPHGGPWHAFGRRGHDRDGDGRHERADHAGRGARGEPFGHARELAKDLELRPDQVDAIRQRARASVGERDREAMKSEMLAGRARMRAIADAFVSDRFDAKALEVGKEAPAMARKMAERTTGLAETALPVLTADQRAKLATKIRERAAKAE